MDWYPQIDEGFPQIDELFLGSTLWQSLSSRTEKSENSCTQFGPPLMQSKLIETRLKREEQAHWLR